MNFVFFFVTTIFFILPTVEASTLRSRQASDSPSSIASESFDIRSALKAASPASSTLELQSTEASKTLVPSRQETLSERIRTMKTAAILVADGSEDTETVTTRNILTRAGMKVIFVAVGGNKNLKLAQGTKVMAEKLIEEETDVEFDVIILPGGLQGSKTFAASNTLKKMLQSQSEKHKYIAAICASPQVVLEPFELLNNKKWTGYRGMRPETAKEDELVVVDGHIITSIGPGTAPNFALKIVELLLGKEKVDSVAGRFFARS